MYTNGRRGLSSTYMLVKILLLVATVGKATITSDEEICVLCKDFTAIILYSLAMLITFICSYFIFDMSLEIYLLNTLRRSGICFRYLLQLSVQQLNRFPFPELSHWIQFLKEISYVITMATSVNALLNHISVQNEWFENYIQRFVILAIIIVLTIYLEFIGQYKGTLRRLFAAIIILTICTGVSVSFTRLFWSSAFCFIFIAVHISVSQFKVYVLCCANKEIADAPPHIAEENKRENTIKRSLNKESGDEPSQKEGMANELLERANVSNVNEREYMDIDSFKRKRNLFETGHESLKKVINEPTIKKLKTKSPRLNNIDEIYFERMCCKQKQPSKNLGFPFGHCVHSKLNLTFGIDSIDSHADEESNKQVEQIANWVLKPVDVIEKPDFQRELVFHEVEILNQQTIHEIGNISNVSDLVQFYESSHKVCQSECSIKNYASGDKSPCKYSTDFEMSEKVEHKWAQKVCTLSNDVMDQNVQTCQNLSYADVKTDFIKIENEGSKTHFYGNEETSLHESKTDYDWSQTAETDFRHDNLNFKKHYLNTDNVVNEIDLRFIYSVY